MIGSDGNSEKWIGIPEAAKLTPYSTDYLSLLARRGRLKAKKVGYNWFTTDEIVKEYLSRQSERRERVEEKWISMPEAAEMSPYSAEYLSLLARKGRLKAKKVGYNWFTTKEVIEKYVDEQLAKKPEPAPTKPARTSSWKAVADATVGTFAAIAIVGSIFFWTDSFAPALAHRIVDETQTANIFSSIKNLFGRKATSQPRYIELSDLAIVRDNLRSELLSLVPTSTPLEAPRTVSAPETVVVYQTPEVDWSKLASTQVVKEIYRDFHHQTDRNVDLIPRAIDTFREDIEESFDTLDLISASSTLTSLFFSTAVGTSATITEATTTSLFSTTASFNTLNLTQLSNGSNILRASRITDTIPTGDFISYWNAAGDTQLFRVDNSGNIYAGGIANSGAITITSVTTPQLRVQYDCNNEITTAVSSTGVTTIGLIGSTPRAIWMPASNSTSTYQFQNAAGTSALTIDTTNLGITTTNSTSTNATSTNLYTTNIKIGSGAVETPSFSFANDPDSGFYSVSDDSMAAVVGESIGVIWAKNGAVVQTKFVDGTAATPSISFANQTNLGLFRPTTQTLGFTTSGSEKMRLTSTGQLGIGTTTPEYILDVNAGNNAIRIGALSDTYTALRLRNSSAESLIGRESSGGGSLGSGSLGNSTVINTGGNYPFQVYANHSPAMTILGNGNVGIGTTTPAMKLQILSAGPLRMGTQTDYFDFVQTAANQWGFLSSGGVYNLTMDSSTGNTGVGTTSPTYKFSVQGGDSQGNVAVFSRDGSGAEKEFYIAPTNNANILLATDGNLKFKTGITPGVTHDSGVEAMTILTSGNVGIGTTTPQNNLHVVGPITISRNNGSDNPFIRFANDVTGLANSKTWVLQANAPGQVGSFRIRNETNDIDPVVINSSGYVGIGTTTPDRNLSVYGGNANNVGLDVLGYNNTGQSAVYLQNSLNNGMFLQINNSAGNPSHLFRSYGDSYVNAVTGNFGVGTSGPGAKLESLATTEQLRLSYDATNYVPFTVSSTGGVTVGRTNAITPTNSWTMKARFYTAEDAQLSLTPEVRVNGLGGFVNGNMYGLKIAPTVTDDASGQELTNFYGIYQLTPTGNPGGITNKYGAYFQDPVGVGESSPDSLLHIRGANASALTPFTGTSFGNIPNITIANSNGTANNFAGVNFSYDEAGSASAGIITQIVSHSTGEGNLIFGTTNSSGTLAERMRISSAGNLGIGETNPSSYKLQVKNNSDVDYSTTTGIPNVVALFGNSTSGALNNSMIAFQTEANGEVYVGAVENAANTRADFAVKMYNGTDRVERFRVTSDGYVGLGVAPGNYKVLGVDDPNAAKFGTLTTGRSGGEYPSVGYAVRFSGTPGSYTYDVSDYAAMIKFGTLGKIETYTASSGTAGNAITFTAGPYVALAGTSWTSSSDVRLKENIETLPVLDRLEDYRAVSFDWKQGGRHDIGVIAQELVEIFPEVVVTTDVEGEYWGVNYDKLGALALQAAKELNAKIEGIELDLASASTSLTVSTSTPGFVSSVFEAIGATLVDGVVNFARLAVGYLTVGEAKADKLCLGETCVTETELIQLLQNSGSQPAPAPAPEPSPEPSLTSTSPTEPEPTASSTEPVATSTEPVTETVSEPEAAPEVVIESNTNEQP